MALADESMALATTLETDDCVLAVLAAADLHTIQAAKAVSRRFCSLGRATLRSAEWLSLRRNLGDLGLAGWAGGVAIQLDTCANERGTEFVHPRNGTRCVSISSRWVACAGDGDVQLWERQTGEYKLRVRHSHHAQVLSVHLRDDLLVVGLGSFPFVSLHRVCERLTDQGRRSEYVLVDLPTVGLGRAALGGLFNARAAWLSDTRLVACVERGDFSNETSSRSSKLIWGGFKYLQVAFAELLSWKSCSEPVRHHQPAAKHSHQQRLGVEH